MTVFEVKKPRLVRVCLPRCFGILKEYGLLFEFFLLEFAFLFNLFKEKYRIET